MLAVLAGAVVQLLRQPGLSPLRTIWAEDGSIFLSQAARYGPLHAVNISYAGYYNLGPRLIAAVAVSVPPSAAAAVLAIAAALCVSMVALLAYVASANHLDSRPARLLIAAFVAVVPAGQNDVLNSIANLHWYGLYAMFWVLLWTPRGWPGRIVGAAVVVLVTGSDILTLGLLPLALLRALQQRNGRRDPYGMTLAALAVLGVGVQLSGLLTGASSRAVQPNPAHAAAWYLVHGLPAGLLGQRWTGGHVTAASAGLAALAWLVVAAAVVIAWRRLTRPAWALALAAGLTGALMYLLPVTLSDVAVGRYAVAPAMLTLTALVALLMPGTGSAGRTPLVWLTALLAVVCAVNLRLANDRMSGPQWGDELRRARAVCAQHAAEVSIPIEPTAVDTTVVVPCSYVDSAR